MAAHIRIKCPYCKEVYNAVPGSAMCPKCHQAVATENQANIYIYRQGSPLGIAGGFGIYINGEPMGHIGNKELIRIPVPYGTYNIHSAVGMSRRCQDMQVTLTPQNNVVYTKVYMKPGVWTNSFVIVPVDPKLLDL